MLSKLPNIKFVSVTLGEKGCLMFERSMTDACEAGEIDSEALFETLEKKVDQSSLYQNAFHPRYDALQCFLVWVYFGMMPHNAHGLGVFWYIQMSPKHYRTGMEYG